MRHALILSSLLVCSFPMFASDVWRISILASEITSTQSDDPWRDDVNAGVGIGLAYAPTPQWDVELTASSLTHRSPYHRVFFVGEPNGPGQVYSVTEFQRYRVIPLDLSLTRHFLTDEAIAPYLRTGVRYVAAPGDRNSPVMTAPGVEIAPIQLAEGFRFNDRLSAQIGAGVRVRLTQRMAIRAEGTRLLRDEGVDFDRLSRYAIGLTWDF